MTYNSGVPSFYAEVGQQLSQSLGRDWPAQSYFLNRGTEHKWICYLHRQAVAGGGAACVPDHRKEREAMGARERLQPKHTPCPNRKQDTSPPPPPPDTHTRLGTWASRRFDCHCHQGQAQRLGQTLLTPPGTQRHAPVTANRAVWTGARGNQPLQPKSQGQSTLPGATDTVEPASKWWLLLI